jgi:hypothetical protein
MQFKLATSNFAQFAYNRKDREKLEQLGFTFIGDQINYNQKPTINIDTLEELIDFIKQYGRITMTEHYIEIR